MKRLLVILLVAVFFLCTFSSAAFSAELVLGSGQAPAGNILKPIEEPFKKATGIVLNTKILGPKDALLELQKGTVEAALGGLSFDDWIAMMKKEKAEVKDPSALQHMVIGKDKIKVLINKDNPVSKLTKDQLKGIFTGKITNWKQVGGKDMPIKIVRMKRFGGNFLFTKNILDGEATTKAAIEVAGAQEAKQAVVSDAKAIALGPLASVDATIKSPDTPEVARPITLITKGKPSPNVKKLIDFIQGEGKKYVKE